MTIALPILGLSDPASVRVRITARSVQDEITGCWRWKGALVAQGYGVIRVGGRRATSAHRASYLAFVGGIASDDLEVDHTCFNPSCVNPDHLRLLPKWSNAARQRKALSNYCARGHEFTPENTGRQKNYRAKGAPWHRYCKACRYGHGQGIAS